MNEKEYSALFDKLRAAYATPVQAKDEFWQLITIVKAINPTNILEIGVEKGGTLKFWDSVVGPEGNVLGMDIQSTVLVPRETFVSNLELVAGDSHTPEAEELIKSKMPVVDFLFIDGDHAYEGVKADFQNFSPLVREGGLIGFHDVYDEGPGSLFDECAQKYKSTKFRQPQGGIGIGVLYL